MTLMEYIKGRRSLLPFMGAVGSNLLGLKIQDVYLSPELQLKVAEYMDKNFPSDFIYPLDDGSIFCDVLGIPIKKPDYNFPMVMDHPVKTEEDILKLKKDILSEERVLLNIEAVKKIKQLNKPIYVSVQGPFTLAVQLAGATHFLKSTIKNPEYAENLLKYTGDLVKSYVKELYRAGVDLISIAEPSSVMISSKQFKKYVLKNLSDIFSEVDCWKIVHICGDTRKIYPQIMTLDIDGFSFDQIMDMSKISQEFSKDKVIIGNLDPIELLGKGSGAEIKSEIDRLDGVMGDNFLLSFGCSAVNNTPAENLKWICNYKRRKDV